MLASQSPSISAVSATENAARAGRPRPASLPPVLGMDCMVSPRKIEGDTYCRGDDVEVSNCDSYKRRFRATDGQLPYCPIWVDLSLRQCAVGHPNRAPAELSQ